MIALEEFYRRTSASVVSIGIPSAPKAISDPFHLPISKIPIRRPIPLDDERKRRGGQLATPPFILDINPKIVSTAGGGTITLTGNNFAPSCVVLIDGNVCSTSFANPNQIFATTPAHAAGYVNVQVINPGPQISNIISGVLQYAAVPTFTSITPDNGDIAGGTSVTIAGTGFVSGATVKFDGINATSISVASSTSITCVTPAHAAGVVQVSITNPTSGFTCSGSYTYGVTSIGVLHHLKFVIHVYGGVTYWGDSGSTVAINPNYTYPFYLGGFDSADNFLSGYNGSIYFTSETGSGGYFLVQGVVPPLTLSMVHGLTSGYSTSGYLFPPYNGASGVCIFQGENNANFALNFLIGFQYPPPQV